MDIKWPTRRAVIVFIVYMVSASALAGIFNDGEPTNWAALAIVVAAIVYLALKGAGVGDRRVL